MKQKTLKPVGKLEGGREPPSTKTKLLVIIFPKLISNGVLVQSELTHRCFVVSFVFNPFNPKSDKNLISP